MPQSQFCTIYLIRHGETVWNVERRMQGQHDSPLTETGLKQARERAQDLAEINFAHIFASDLLRAQQTAEIIAVKHQLVITANKLLRERHYGPYEGRLGTEYQEELKDLLETKEKLSLQEQFRFKIHPEIESDEEIVTRTIQFLREISLAYLGQTVAAISHGGIIYHLLHHLGYFKPNTRYHVDNLGYAVIHSDGIDFKVQKVAGITER